MRYSATPWPTGLTLERLPCSMRYSAVATLAAATASSRVDHRANGEEPFGSRYSTTFRGGMFIVTYTLPLSMMTVLGRCSRQGPTSSATGPGVAPPHFIPGVVRPWSRGPRSWNPRPIPYFGKALFPQAAFVEGAALDQMVPECAGGPDAELGAAKRFDAVTNRNDDIEIVKSRLACPNLQYAFIAYCLPAPDPLP